MSGLGPSRGEAEAWKQLRLLRAEDFAFRREHNLGAYRADFVCLRRRLIVEVDGGVHAFPGAPAHDAKRDAWLRAEGFVVLRFTDQVIVSERNWLNEVRKTLKARPDAPYRQRGSSPHPLAPSPSRGGGKEPFWKTKSLAEMSETEWESLCDGCGKCCLISLEDEDTSEIYLTDVACKLFESGACRCSDYANRKKRVPDCVKLTPKNVPTLNWLPNTCAYRLVSEKRDLFWWHPLVSGDPNTVHQAKASVRGKTRPEGRLQVPGLMKRITKWPKPKEKPPKKRARPPKRGGGA